MGRRFLVVVGCLVAMLVAVAPAAANNKPTTGTRIGLYTPPATFPANTAFYIEHGWACELGDGVCLGEQISAHSDFVLTVDGVVQPSTVDVDNVDGILGKLRLTNFPSGLPAGTHTFVGTWYLDGVVSFTETAVITFT